MIPFIFVFVFSFKMCIANWVLLLEQLNLSLRTFLQYFNCSNIITPVEYMHFKVGGLIGYTESAYEIRLNIN